MDYTDRNLTGVEFFSFSPHYDDDGEHWVTANLTINLSGIEGRKSGPNVSVVVSTKVDDGATLAEAERIALAAALAVIKRVSAETPQSLDDRLTKKRERPSLLNPTAL